MENLGDIEVAKAVITLYAEPREQGGAISVPQAVSWMDVEAEWRHMTGTGPPRPGEKRQWRGIERKNRLPRSMMEPGDPRWVK